MPAHAALGDVRAAAALLPMLPPLPNPRRLRLALAPRTRVFHGAPVSAEPSQGPGMSRAW
jgi:hypothetical protein